VVVGGGNFSSESGGEGGFAARTEGNRPDRFRPEGRLADMEREPETPPGPPWWRVALIGRRPRRTLVRLLVLVVLTVLLFRFVLVLVRIEGISMSPTFRDKHVGIVYRLAYLFHEPQRGDVVAIRPLAGERAGYYLKRIVGLPGDSIAFHAGQLLINGQPLDEPYLKRSYSWEMEPMTIGPGSYYVVGDNRTMDRVDHFQGRASRERIIGKILL